MSTVFKVALNTDAVEFNEVYRNYTGSGGYFVANNIFSRLVLYGTKSAAVYPDLAEHWEMLDGGRRYRFELARDAKWHDGAPVTAHDVAYTHRHAIENNYHAASFLTGIERIDEVDEHTVEYVLTEPNTGFLVQMGNFVFTHVLPAHLYEGTDWATNPHNLNPVGSGPFKFVEWVPGERMVLERFDDYFGPRPAVDRVEITIETDPDTILRGVSDGTFDYMPEGILTPSQYESYPATADAVLHSEPIPSIDFLGFNWTRPAFGDRRVRLALAKAVDPALVDALPGEGISTRNYFPPIMEAVLEPSAQSPEFDPAGAEALLDESGLTRGADGVRARWTLRHMSNFAMQGQLAQLVAQALAKVGIELEITALDPVSWSGTVGKDADFDLLVTGGNMMPDPEITASRFMSTGRRNVHRYASAATDEAYTRARRATDRIERNQAFKDLQHVWAEEIATIPLHWGRLEMLRSKHFFGWSDQVDSRVPFWHWGRIRPI